MAFEPILNFMETKYEDARAAYMAMLPEHVGSALRDYEPLQDLLRSDLAIDRFVPREWVGIAGVRTTESAVESDPEGAGRVPEDAVRGPEGTGWVPAIEELSVEEVGRVADTTGEPMELVEGDFPGVAPGAI